MKKQFLSLLTALYLLLCVTPLSVMAAASAAVNPAFPEETAFESEHPPLSDTTKKAIAAYKKNPTEDSRQSVLDALNEAYDFVVQNKKNNLEKYTQARTEKINAWLNTVLKGGMPPFMSLSTDNNKGTERQAVADAVEAYRNIRSSENKELVKQALENYYDAFLHEQEEHIVETEELRESRIADSLERFTSDLFKPQVSTSNTIEQEAALAEIICAYISVGAEIVPVNPEARVREREINGAVSNAQMLYINDPNEENMKNLQNEVERAFQIAYEVRLEAYAVAESKGMGGANALFPQILNADFRSEQFRCLTEQLNLYGRIDRMVTYGSNTYGEWIPRMKEESEELAGLLRVYQASPTAENEQDVKAKFYEIYSEVLIIQKEHLAQTDINSFTEEILHELVD